MTYLFINGSPRRSGNTAKLAETVLKNREYTTLNLADYHINTYGQTGEGDQFNEVLTAVKEADTVVLGSPMYWYSMSGAMRTLLDRFFGPVKKDELSGRKLVFLFQGADPEQWMLDAGDYTMKKFAEMYGMEYMGMAVTAQDADGISKMI